MVKSDKIPGIKTQIKIVNVLLDGSKKYQRQIAAEIGRGESTTSRALDYLVRENVVLKEEKEVDGGKRNKGKYAAKLCFLSYETDNGVNIINFYRDILNSKTLTHKEEGEIINTLEKCEKTISSVADKLHFFTEMPGPTHEIKQIIETENREKLKTMLKLSTTFFKMCLQQSADALNSAAIDVFWLSDKGQAQKLIDDSIQKSKITKNNPTLETQLINCVFGNHMVSAVDIIFQSCVNTDILNGLKNKEAYVYMETLSQTTGWCFGEIKYRLEDLTTKQQSPHLL